MELIFKTAAAAVSTAIIALTIRKTNPELTTALCLCTVSIILICACSFAAELKTLIKAAMKIGDLPGVYVLSILKCLAVSIITRVSTELCRDAGQGALASAVEFAGSVCAVSLVLPLVSNMLELIGELV